MEFFKKQINDKYILFYYEKIAHNFTIGLFKRFSKTQYHYITIKTNEDVLKLFNKEDIQDAIFQAIFVNDISNGRHCSVTGPLEFIYEEWEDENPKVKLDKKIIENDNLYIDPNYPY